MGKDKLYSLALKLIDIITVKSKIIQMREIESD